MDGRSMNDRGDAIFLPDFLGKITARGCKKTEINQDIRNSKGILKWPEKSDGCCLPHRNRRRAPWAQTVRRFGIASRRNSGSTMLLPARSFAAPARLLTGLNYSKRQLTATARRLLGLAVLSALILGYATNFKIELSWRAACSVLGSIASLYVLALAVRRPVALEFRGATSSETTTMAGLRRPIASPGGRITPAPIELFLPWKRPSAPVPAIEACRSR